MSKTIAKASVRAATRKSAIVKPASSKKVAVKTTAKKATVKKAVAKKIIRKAPAKKAVAKKIVRKAPVRKAASKKLLARKPRTTAKAAAVTKLCQIKGIGAKMAEVLYNNGVKSQLTMSKMLKADIDRLSAKLKIGNRISRENWVGQAKKLVRASSKRK